MDFIFFSHHGSWIKKPGKKSCKEEAIEKQQEGKKKTKNAIE